MWDAAHEIDDNQSDVVLWCGVTLKSVKTCYDLLLNSLGLCRSVFALSERSWPNISFLPLRVSLISSVVITMVLSEFQCYAIASGTPTALLYHTLQGYFRENGSGGIVESLCFSRNNPVY